MTITANNRQCLWRSLLFVPAHITKFTEKVHLRKADGIIFDLEDGVPLSHKHEARTQLAAILERDIQGHSDILVRINSNWRMAIRDLEAVISPKVSAIMLPKVESDAQIHHISEVIDELEAEMHMEAGSTRLIAVIESASALLNLQKIAKSSPRLAAMSLGSEDFTMSVGMTSGAEGLMLPNQLIAFSAHSAGIIPLGFVGSIADYSERDTFRQTIRQARRLGFQGACCVHPDQVDILNEEFAPNVDEVKEALQLINAYEEGITRGLGAVSHNGKMVDLPVVKRARKLLSLHEQIHEC